VEKEEAAGSSFLIGEREDKFNGTSKYINLCFKIVCRIMIDFS
jgi:hypothetical protein